MKCNLFSFFSLELFILFMYIGLEMNVPGLAFDDAQGPK